MELRAAYAFLLALSLAMVLIPPLMRVAGPLRLMDAGGGRKVHTGRVPRIGGVAIFVAFLLPVLLWMPMSDGVGAFVAATAVLFTFGLLDDRFNLDYRLKLLGQALAAGIVVIGGDVLIQHVPYWPGGMLPEPLAIPLTLLLLVGLTNAINLSDGLDGLAGGISLLAVACLLFLDAGSAVSPLMIVLAALLGAVLGFLRFNTFPARLFMGDAGSQLLGFSVGVLATMVTQRPEAGLSPTLPLLLLGLPILDMLTVIIGRIRRGQSPLKADRTHLHHRLLDSGLSQSESVALLYGLQFLLVALAYLLRNAADWVILLTYLLFCALALSGERAFEHYRAQLYARPMSQRPLGRFRRWLRDTRLPVHLSYRILGVAVPSYLILGALSAQSVDADIGLLAAALSAALLAALFIRRLPFFALERLSAYTAAVAVAFLLMGSRVEAVCSICIVALYGTLAVAAAVWLRFAGKHFQVTTLDMLVLLGALVAPSLREFGLRDIGTLALVAVVLFYSIEILLQGRARGWDALRVGTLTCLGTLAVKGLLL